MAVLAVAIFARGRGASNEDIQAWLNVNVFAGAKPLLVVLATVIGTYVLFRASCWLYERYAIRKKLASSACE